MSLKPPKKSDLGKSWMKNRRDKARMIQPEYHLIASEGTETEPQYFGAIQRIINSKYRDRIQLKVEGIGDNTVNLLMKARQYVQNNGIVFKHVWIVYDTDDFPAENIDMVAQLCEEYSAQGETIYHAVWSNQCVELWYLLHFMYMDTDIDRSRYWPKLSDWLKNIGAGSYEKNRPDMYEVLRLSPSRKNGQEKCEKSRMKQTGANESKVKRQKLHTAAFQNRRAISIQSKSEDELCCRKLQYKQRYRSVPPAWSGSGADEPAHISDS